MTDDNVRDAARLLREAEDAIETEQEADLAEFERWADEARAAIAGTRDELEAAREEADRERKDEEAQARAGQLGSERQALQRRLDSGETTWEDVILNRDSHPTAQNYRDTMAAAFEQAVAELRSSDPDFDAELTDLQRRAEVEPAHGADRPPPPKHHGTW